MDASYPSMVAHYLYKVGLIHGHAKIQYTMLSMVSRSSFFFQVLTAKGLNKQWQNLPVGIFEIMQGYMKYGATFNVSFPSDENAPPLLTGCDRSRVQNSRKIYIASVQDATIYCTIIKYYGQTLYLCRGTIILVR